MGAYRYGGGPRSNQGGDITGRESNLSVFLYTKTGGVMGGRGASSSVSGGSLGALEKREATLSKQIDSLGERMVKVASRRKGGAAGMTQKDRKEWNSLKDKQNNLKDKRRKIQDKRASLSRKQAKKEHKTYVNGYGEATHRNITSTTYERALKRSGKNVDNWFGRGMNKK